MSLGKREANAKHDRGVAKQAGSSSEAYWMFKPGQKVMTCDGFPGVVARVEDGPHAGNEHYIVELDNGMGGGAYRSSDLSTLNQTASSAHTAADDYPELGEVLYERPDPAKEIVTLGHLVQANASCPNCNTWALYRDPGSDCPACGHEMAHEDEGTLAPHHQEKRDPQRIASRTASVSCPLCGYYMGGTSEHPGDPCPMCHATMTGTEAQEAPATTGKFSCPDCGFYQGSGFSGECPICSRKKKTGSSHPEGTCPCNEGGEPGLDEGGHLTWGGHSAGCGDADGNYSMFAKKAAQDCDLCGGDHDSLHHYDAEHDNGEGYHDDSDLDGMDDRPASIEYGNLPHGGSGWLMHDGEKSLGGYRERGVDAEGSDPAHDEAHATLHSHQESQGYYPGIECTEDNGGLMGDHHQQSVNTHHRRLDRQDAESDLGEQISDMVPHGDLLGDNHIGPTKYSALDQEHFSHYSRGINSVHDADDENFARITDGGLHHAHCEESHQGRYPGLSSGGISFRELRQKLPHGATCDECMDEITGPRPHSAHECELGGDCESFDPEEHASFYDDPHAVMEHMQNEGVDIHHKPSVPHLSENDPMHDHFGSDDDLHAEQADQNEWENTYHQRKSDEDSASHQIDEHFSGPSHQDALHMLDSNPQGPSHYSMLVEAAGDSDFRFHITATWNDVRNKAKRLRSEGRVKMLAVGSDHIAAEVKGDHHVYETVLQYAPGTKKIGFWQCGCKWSAYSWGRSGRWKRFEGRMCSHALATTYEAQSRGMFGKEVTPDKTRPVWQKAHQPVVVEFDKAKDKNLTRRAVPPGNMRRTFGSHDEQIIPNNSCPACGGPIEHCGGSTRFNYGDHYGDDFAHEAIDNHESGDHSICNPYGCGDAHDLEGQPQGRHDHFDGPNYDEQDPFSPRHSALHTLIAQAIIQGDDPAEIVMAITAAGIDQPQMQFQAGYKLAHGDHTHFMDDHRHSHIELGPEDIDAYRSFADAGKQYAEQQEQGQRTPANLNDIHDLRHHLTTAHEEGGWVHTAPHDELANYHDEDHDTYGEDWPDAVFMDGHHFHTASVDMDEDNPGGGNGAGPESGEDEEEQFGDGSGTGMGGLGNAAASLRDEFLFEADEPIRPTAAFLAPLVPELLAGGEAAAGAAGAGEAAAGAGEAAGEGSSLLDKAKQVNRVLPKGHPGGDTGSPTIGGEQGSNSVDAHSVHFGTFEPVPEGALPETDGEVNLEGDQGTGVEDPETMDVSPAAGGADTRTASWQAEVALAAKQFLAKTSMKTFTPGEQAAIINEGEGVHAANLDRLEITGTHYEALEAALGSDDDEDDAWL